MINFCTICKNHYDFKDDNCRVTEKSELFICESAECLNPIPVDVTQHSKLLPGDYLIQYTGLYEAKTAIPNNYKIIVRKGKTIDGKQCFQPAYINIIPKTDKSGIAYNYQAINYNSTSPVQKEIIASYKEGSDSLMTLTH